MRNKRTLGIIAIAALSLAGCSVTVKSDSTPTTGASASPAADTRPGVWGLSYGEIPAIPLFDVPNISVMSDAQAQLAENLETKLAKLNDIPGLELEVARCDSTGALVRGDAVLYGDGSGSYVDETGTTVNYGDGSGSQSDDDQTLINYGDGSGNYTNGDVTIINYGDGSGNYTDGQVSVIVYGDGSGNYTDDNKTIINYGDGSGNYSSGETSIINYGDGSGNFNDGDVSIVNNGDGTGLVNGQDVEMEPLAVMPPIGVFPPIEAMTALPPTCGLILTLPDGVLFDFGSDQLRPSAAEVITQVAQALTTAQVSGTVSVYGHTDSISSDEFNQDLSERRANAVANALTHSGMTNQTDVEGFGESQPVAPNEINGADNPAGRQLNRRVEIVIPAM